MYKGRLDGWMSIGMLMGGGLMDGWVDWRRDRQMMDE